MRKSILTLAALACVVSSAAEERSWRFRVLLDDKPIGFHEYRITRNDGIEQVESQASFDVKFLFFTAYRYRHTNLETWRDGCLVNIEAQTDANGKELNVTGEQAEQGFRVATGDSDRELAECVRSFAYWNPVLLNNERLLNPQTGEFEQVDVRDAGSEQIMLNGSRVTARRVDIDVREKTVNVWYGEDGRWLALSSPAKGNRVLRYEAETLPPAELFVARNEESGRGT